MYESCLAVGTAADRDSLADVSFDPLTVAYDCDCDDTKGEEANERTEDEDGAPRFATTTRPRKLPRGAKLPYVRAPPTFAADAAAADDADDATVPFLRWWFFHVVFTAPEWHPHAA